MAQFECPECENLKFNIKRQLRAFQVLFDLNTNLSWTILKENIEDLIRKHDQDQIVRKTSSSTLEEVGEAQQQKREMSQQYSESLFIPNSKCDKRKEKRMRDSLWNDGWETNCRSLLDDLWTHKDSSPFRDPDYSSDYQLFIDKPMCLSQIRNKLDNGDYHDQPRQFHEDIMLIFRNSKIYNPIVTSEIRVQSQSLQDYYESHLILEKLELEQSSNKSMSILSHQPVDDLTVKIKEEKIDETSNEMDKDDDQNVLGQNVKCVSNFSSEDHHVNFPKKPRRLPLKKKVPVQALQIAVTRRRRRVNKINENQSLTLDQDKDQEIDSTSHVAMTLSSPHLDDVNDNDKALTKTKLKEADQHIKSELIKGRRYFKCLICNKALTLKVNARFHVRRVHFNDRVVCLKCNRSFYDSRLLRLHKCVGETTLKQKQSRIKSRNWNSQLVPTSIRSGNRNIQTQINEHFKVAEKEKKIIEKKWTLKIRKSTRNKKRINLSNFQSAVKVKTKTKTPRLRKNNEKTLLKESKKKDGDRMGTGIVVRNPFENFDLSRTLNVQLKLEKVDISGISSTISNSTSIENLDKINLKSNDENEISSSSKIGISSTTFKTKDNPIKLKDNSNDNLIDIDAGSGSDSDSDTERSNTSHTVSTDGLKNLIMSQKSSPYQVNEIIENDDIFNKKSSDSILNFEIVQKSNMIDKVDVDEHQLSNHQLKAIFKIDASKLDFKEPMSKLPSKMEPQNDHQKKIDESKVIKDNIKGPTSNPKLMTNIRPGVFRRIPIISQKYGPKSETNSKTSSVELEKSAPVELDGSKCADKDSSTFCLKSKEATLSVNEKTRNKVDRGFKLTDK